MKKIKYYIEKYKTLLIILIIILVLGIFLIFNLKNNNEKEQAVENVQIIDNKVEDEIPPKKIKVDIKGYVENPGVYELDENSRVVDVINQAGGLKEEGNTEYINLSKKLTDEMIIIIYSDNEVEKFKEVEKEIIYIEYKCVCPDNINSACITEEDTVNTNGVKEDSDLESKEDNLVSINSATLEELMTLTGIGESKAKAIIEYREKNGEFKALEDIMNVSGIGESAYSKIKDNIKL